MTYSRPEIERRDRTNVEWFSGLMLTKMAKYEDKPGWQEQDRQDLIRLMTSEVREFGHALEKMDSDPSDLNVTETIMELADIGNSAMIVASWLAVHHQGQDRLR